MDVKVLYWAVPHERQDTLLYKTMKEYGYTLLLAATPFVGYIALEESSGNVVMVPRELVHSWIREVNMRDDICDVIVKESIPAGLSLIENLRKEVEKIGPIQSYLDSKMSYFTTPEQVRAEIFEESVPKNSGKFGTGEESRVNFDTKPSENWRFL